MIFSITEHLGIGTFIEYVFKKKSWIHAEFYTINHFKDILKK